MRSGRMRGTPVTNKISSSLLDGVSITGFGRNRYRLRGDTLRAKGEAPLERTPSPAGMDIVAGMAEVLTDAARKSATAWMISSSQAAREPSQTREVRSKRRLSIRSPNRMTIASTPVPRPSMKAITRAHGTVICERRVSSPARRTARLVFLSRVWV